MAAGLTLCVHQFRFYMKIHCLVLEPLEMGITKVQGMVGVN